MCPLYDNWLQDWAKASCAALCLLLWLFGRNKIAGTVHGANMEHIIVDNVSYVISSTEVYSDADKGSSLANHIGEVLTKEQIYVTGWDEDNYIHLRKKMTKDIGKLLKPEYIKKLKVQFSTTVDLASIGELKQDLVASWLADCSMEFRM